jgi:hypothetical protein
MPSLEEEIRMDGRIHMRRLLLLIVPLASAGCATPAPAPAGSPVLASPSTPSVNPTYGTGVPTERGSLPKVIGQHAAITNPGTTDVVVDFVPSGVEGVRCNRGLLTIRRMASLLLSR